MKFGIKKVKYLIKTNINGKVLEVNTSYYVYRKIFFGLFKAYVHLCPSYHWKSCYQVSIRYTNLSRATSLGKEEAEELIKAFKEQLDKFVRYGKDKLYVIDQFYKFTEFTDQIH